MSHKSLSGFIGFSSSSNFVSLQRGQKDSDSKRLQALASVSNQELENIRRATRLLEGEREEPHIDTRVVIQRNAHGAIPILE